MGGLKPGGVHDVVERVGHLRAGLEALVAVAGQGAQDDAVELGRTEGVVHRGGRHLARRTRSTVCRSFSPLNRRRPVSTSCSTMPQAKMSMRLSTSLPAVCSGAMYANLPLRVPRWVLPSSTEPSPPSALAMPKSSSLTAPSYDSITFDGETSRWIIPSELAVVTGQVVGVGQGAAHLAADVGHQLGPGRADAGPEGPHRLGQVAAFDVLHRDEVLLVDRPQLEDLDDVGVVEAGRQLGLLDEHARELGVVGEVRQDALDHEHALEPGGTLDAALEDVGHAAAADAFEQRVFAELNRLRKHYPHGA